MITPGSYPCWLQAEAVGIKTRITKNIFSETLKYFVITSKFYAHLTLVTDDDDDQKQKECRATRIRRLLLFMYYSGKERKNK